MPQKKISPENAFILIGLLPAIAILGLMIKQGHLTYTLDDPYIHMELANNIWNGNYGINSNEFSAPSSSIIWPFLLAPFATSISLLEIAPIIINMTSLVFILIVFKIIIQASRNKIAATTCALLALISTNQYGLIFNGMEHSLQCLVSIYIAWRAHSILIEKKETFDTALGIAIVSLPLIRYESISISGTMLIALYMSGFRKEAIITAILSATPIAAFSAFIYSGQESYLPSSIIAKTVAATSNPLYNLIANINSHYLYLLIFLVPALIFTKNNTARFLIITPFIIHMTFGSIGWFARYEPYIFIYIATILILYFKEKSNALIVIGLTMLSTLSHMAATSSLTVAASDNIYNQQQQMAEIARKLDAPVAVNDLGLVSLRTEKYVLDLYGLGSMEALKLRSQSKNTDWVGPLLRSNDVKYMIIYDEWISPPKNSIHVSTLKLKQRKITPSEDNVEFYATDKKSALIMKNAIELHKKSSDYEFIIHEI